MTDLQKIIDEGWIETVSGSRFYPLQPHKSFFRLGDIAHALSYICRFAGHSSSFYSVGDHSIRVSLIVPEKDAMWGLLHDASEAYLVDIPKPLKIYLPDYRRLEESVQSEIAQRFGLQMPMPESVKLADRILLRTEQRDLMPYSPDVWDKSITPLKDIIIPLSPTEAKQKFLDRFKELSP